MTCVFFTFFDFVAIVSTRNKLNEQSDFFSQTLADYLEEFATKQTKMRLSDVAELQSKHMERELEHIAQDVLYLTAMTEAILKSPQNYSPQVLPDSSQQPIRAGQTYLHISRDVRNQINNPVVWQEIGLLSNLNNTLSALDDKYKNLFSSAQIGSKYGYMIVSDETGTAKGNIAIMTRDYMEHFDPRKRPWYEAAVNANEPVFTDPYIGSAGVYEITCSMPYYDNNGFAGVAGISATLQSTQHMVEMTMRGKEGFSFVLDRTGKIVFSAKKEGTLSVGNNLLNDISANDANDNPAEENSLAKAAQHMVAGEIGEMYVRVEGEDYFLAFSPMHHLNCSFGTLMKKTAVTTPASAARHGILQQMHGLGFAIEDIFSSLEISMLVILSILMIAVIFFSRHMATSFVKPIYQLTRGVREIYGGNLKRKLAIHTGDEIEHLAICFNAMTDELSNYMENLTRATAEKQRILTELSVATNIQSSMLPDVNNPFPDRDEFDIYAIMRAAKKVGGDFYDFSLLDKNRLIITIADVSGKGVPAALFMVTAKTVLNNFARYFRQDNKLDELVNCVNRHLCQNNETMMFATAFIGVLDLTNGHLVYVNAGHNPPLIYRAVNDSFAYIHPQKNCPLGVDEDMVYKQEELDFTPGDLIYLYTDGVTEALNENQELFGETKLLNALNSFKMKEMSLPDLLKKISAKIAAHVQNAPQSDDITMLTLSYRRRLEPESEGESHE